MKKILYVLGFLVLLIVAAAIIVPIVLKEPITKAVKKEANANLNAVIDFTDVNISLLRSFPDLYVGVEGLSVTGKDDFEGRTLVTLGALVLDVDLMSAFGGKPIINEIALTNGLANIIVLENGKANYDIVPESEEAYTEESAEPAASEEGAFAIQLKRFRVDGLEVMYNDLEGGMSFSTSNIEMTLGGDFSADRTSLNTNLLLETVKLKTGGVSYLNGVELELKADVDADMANKSYTLNQNEFRINGLHLALDGNISMPNEDD
ncbi:MAG: AsmA family protein, partial [Flavobacteriales bacterium]